jgi:ankyrin repeat protein
MSENHSLSGIHDAAGRGDVEEVIRLLESDPTLANTDDEHEWRPIFHAGLKRRTKVVRTLLDYGADVSAHDGYALHYAAEVTKNLKVVEMLVNAGALEAYTRPPDDTMRELLHAVFLKESVRVSSLLRRDHSLATRRSGTGLLTIHYAAQNGDTDIVESLLDAGCGVDATYDGGLTVLYCAAGHGHADTVGLLLNRGVDHEVRLPEGKTVQEWLAQYPGSRRYARISTQISDARL